MTIQKCVTNEYVGHLSLKVSMVIGSRLILPLPSTVCMAKRGFIKYWLYLFVHLFMDSFVLQIWKRFETWWNLIYPFDWSSTPWRQSSTLLLSHNNSYDILRPGWNLEMQKELTRIRSLSSHREWLRENVMEYDFPTCLNANKKNRRPTHVERLP